MSLIPRIQKLQGLLQERSVLTKLQMFWDVVFFLFYNVNIAPDMPHAFALSGTVVHHPMSGGRMDVLVDAFPRRLNRSQLLQGCGHW